MLEEKQQLENKIIELSKRIEILEKKELKRTRKKQLQIGLQILKIIAILLVIFIVYTKINNTLIKPYKEKIDYIEEKTNNVENFVQEKWESIKKLNPFDKS